MHKSLLSALVAVSLFGCLAGPPPDPLDAAGEHNSTPVANDAVSEPDQPDDPAEDEVPSGAENAGTDTLADVSNSCVGGWSVAGELFEAGDNPSATLLPDGRILVAGGFQSASSEIYSPDDRRSVRVESMPVQRRFGAPVTLSDGSVLIVGGTIERSDFESWEPAREPVRFNPSRGGWERLAPAPDSRVLRWGGVHQLGPDTVWSVSSTGAAKQLNLRTGEWSDLAASPPPGAGAWSSGLRLPDGRIALVGSDAQLAIYDAAARTWEDIPAPAVPPATTQCNSIHAAVLPNGNLIHVTGAHTLVFDFAARSWDVRPPPFESENGVVGATLSDGRILVAEYDGLRSAIFEPTEGRWVPAANLNSRHVWGFQVFGLPDGRAAIIGGTDPQRQTFNSTPSTVELFDPTGAAGSAGCPAE